MNLNVFKVVLNLMPEIKLMYDGIKTLTIQRDTQFKYLLRQALLFVTSRSILVSLENSSKRKKERK